MYLSSLTDFITFLNELNKLQDKGKLLSDLYIILMLNRSSKIRNYCTTIWINNLFSYFSCIKPTIESFLKLLK